jgi:signal transduction histidine kinase
MPQQRGFVIEMQTELEPTLPPIMGLESELREALINLVFNAVDAMPDGGTLTLRTRSSSSTSAEERLTLRHVYLEVCDTGVGMDEETQRRCLEPFFTTKGERGSGLGLAMVYGIVQRHNAELEIDSTVGKGTTIRLIFAASRGALEVEGNPSPYVDRVLSKPPKLRELRVALAELTASAA